jgi:sugar phosphate isomerase/epimerase
MLYTTSLCSAQKKIAEAVRELARLGFRNIELTGRTEFYTGLENDLCALKKEYQLDFLIHNYFPPPPVDFVLNLASRDPDIKEKSLSLIKQAVSLAKKLGKDLYSFHPGFRNNLLPQLEDGFFIKGAEGSNSKKDFYRMLDLILDGVIPDGFRIAVENLCPHGVDNLYSFLTTPTDIEEFLDYYKDRANIGFLLDMGHLNVAAHCFDFIQEKFLDNLFSRYGDKIFEIHLSENDGLTDTHKISSVDSWQIEFLFRNRKALEGVPIVLEWQLLANSSSYESFRVLRDKLGE